MQPDNSFTPGPNPAQSQLVPKKRRAMSAHIVFYVLGGFAAFIGIVSMFGGDLEFGFPILAAAIGIVVTGAVVQTLSMMLDSLEDIRIQLQHDARSRGGQ